MNKIYIGRQPILDLQQDTVGYELYFRSSQYRNEALFDHSDLASSQVILNTFLEVGLEFIVGSQPAFINLHDSFLTNRYPIPISHEQTVFEITLKQAPDARLLEAVTSYRALGYRFAIDHYRATPECQALIQLCDYAKVTLGDRPPQEIQSALKDARGRGVEVIAQRVETLEHFTLAEEAGCRLFQGYFFAVPKVVSGKPLAGNLQVISQLLARLDDPDTQLGELERLLAQDATLTFRLLRYANSATFALRTEVDSLRKAIILIGAETIKKWASLILMARLQANKPSELLVTAMVRARMCELMAERRAPGQRTAAFTVGLLSILDALTDSPMVEILDSMPLTNEIKVALLDHDGPLGEMLKPVLAYERLEWDLLDQVPEASHLNELYFKAIHWAEANTTLLRQQCD